MPDAMAQPNEEAPNHHDAVTVKGQDGSGTQPLAITLDAAAQLGGGGADPKHPHLFHLASTAGSA